LFHNVFTVNSLASASNTLSANLDLDRKGNLRMRNVCLLSMMLCAGAFAQTDTIVRWRGMEGVITAPGVDNPVGQIHSGAGPWTTRGGSARIDFTSGEG